jgi:heat shock protein HslJ
MHSNRPLRTRVRLVLLGLTALALVLGACGDTADTGSTHASIKGPTWVTTELTVDGVRHATPSGSRIEITLGTDGMLRARGGCNSMSGGYALKGDTLSVTSLAMTEMGCAADLMALDTTIATLLDAKPTVTLADATLTVASATTTLTLVDLETVEPTPPLVGTTWTLDTLITGDVASSIPQGLTKPITLVFGADGRYTIVTGCNGLGGEFTRDGTKVTVKPGPTTLIGCPAPLDTLETAIGGVFSDDVIATIQRQRLTVMAKSGNGLGFSATK